MLIFFMVNLIGLVIEVELRFLERRCIGCVRGNRVFEDMGS